MYVLKGFLSYLPKVNNASGVVNNLGEISTRSLTYARDKGTYKLDAAPNLILTTFITKNDTTHTPMISGLTTHVMTVLKAVWDFTLAAPGEIFADDLLNSLLTTFGSSAADFTCGAIVNDGTDYLPEWVAWRNTSLSGSVGANNLKVWLSDAAFQAQYDSFEMTIVPPSAAMNDFFKTPSEVKTMIGQFDQIQQMTRVQTARGVNPETVLKAYQFEWVNPFNSADKVKATWYVLIYGLAGDNIDSVKDALADHAITNSSHTREQWLPLLPELFRRTEFMMLPVWDQYAIPNLTTQTGIYATNTNLKRAIALAKTVIGSGYQSSHIDDHVTMMAHPYKSLMVLLVGGAENRNSLFEINQVFSDIIQMPLSSTDFNRMSAGTKTWLTSLAQALVTAESMTDFTSVPNGFTKVKRNNKLYLVFSQDNINYLVLAKSQLTVVIDGE